MPILQTRVLPAFRAIFSVFLVLGGGFFSTLLFAGSLEISWDPVASPAVAGYRIRYGTATQTYTQSVDVGNVTSHVLRELANNTPYYVMVAAYDANGVEGLPSAEASGISSSDTTPTTLLSINTGGSRIGQFGDDSHFSGGAAGATIQPIDTTLVTNPAPAEVYQTERFGSDFTYSFVGLPAGSAYDVRLHFAEFYWTSFGQRKFDVTINGDLILHDFDILASAGDRFRATIQQFRAIVNSSGQINVRFSQGSADLAKIGAIELVPADQSAGQATEINSGGDLVGSFQADRDFQGGEAEVFQQTIDTSFLLDPAPQEVYQSERHGSDFSYLIPNLMAGRSYRVRLHFAEALWSNVGDRKFDVSINGQTVLKEFDIIAAAGVRARAIIQEFLAVADEGGRIAIRYTAGSADLAKSNGVQIIPVAPVVALNAGGGAAGSFNGDNLFSGGEPFGAGGAPIDVSEVMPRVPPSIYASERVGYFTYTIPNLVPGNSYLVRLHFAETHWRNPGQRKFHVSINQERVLQNFDITAAAGSSFKAIVQQFAAKADNNGQIVIEFSRGSQDTPKVSAIEVLR